jgi:hypothetical protein
MHPRAAITSTRKTKMNGTFSWNLTSIVI